MAKPISKAEYLRRAIIARNIGVLSEEGFQDTLRAIEWHAKKNADGWHKKQRKNWGHNEK